MSTGGQSRARTTALRLRQLSPRQQLTATLLLGALGAGLVFLATRQGWAQVRTVLPNPLPASKVTVTGAALVPYADALVIAGLATLAAVLASRGWVRRLTGALLVVIAAALAASVYALTAADAVSAVRSTVTPESAAAGSVMDGSGTAATTGPDVAGTATHVTFSAAGWQALVVAGAVAMAAAGLLVIIRAGRLAVMSSRYDSPAGAARPEPASAPGPARSAAGPAQPGTHQPDSGQAAEPRRADTASLWEALSRGDDPTETAGSTAGTSQP